jgi:uncharacterized protein
MGDILKEILGKIPGDKVSDAGFEGANIILYTKDQDFFLDNKGMIRDIVNDIKKRIELRPDPNITMDTEKAERFIMKLMPKEAGVDNVIFDEQRSRVIIEADKPGLAIGKEGQLLRDIRAKTMWVPLIRRKPALRSKIIDNIRAVLYQNSDWRRKFLNRVGHRVYDGWIRGKKNEWVRATYLGGARQVGRSCILLQTPESRVLMDCGIDPARQVDDPMAFPYLECPEFKIEELDAVIVSHAHLDHTGMVPYLFKFGYDGPVYCTAPTRDIMSLLQLDMIKIARSEGKDPLYDSEQVKECVKHTICLDYEEVTDITPDMRLTFYNSGHMLGSAMSHLHIGNGLHNLLYTADIKFVRTHVLDRAATKFPRLETMMLESTYGGKDNVMPPMMEQDAYLAKVLQETFERGGKVLMPVLGSGRAQEVIVMVEKLMREKKIKKDVNVYIDGMVWDISAIHTAYPEFLNPNLRKMIFHKDDNPFLSPLFKRVGSQKERMQIIEDEGSCLILATSGMMVGGPSVEYFKHLAASKKNSLVFSCYQGEGSMGRRIKNGDRQIIESYSSSGKPNVIKVELEVHTLEITNHADRKELVNFVYKCDPKPKKVIVNHGENSRCLDLASYLHKANRIETNAPRNLEAVRIK